MGDPEITGRFSRTKTSLPLLRRPKSMVREEKTLDDIRGSNGKQSSKTCKIVASARKKEKLPDITDRNKNATSKANGEEDDANSKPTDLMYDIDSLTWEEMQDALRRIKDDPIQPLEFLADVLDDVKPEEVPDEASKPTDIDVKRQQMQLLSVMRRIELNKTLLERTNERVKNVKFLTEEYKSSSAAKLLEDEKQESKESCADQASTDLDDDQYDVIKSRIDHLRQTMNVTMDMLDYVKKMSKDDTQLEDLPPNLADYMKVNDIVSPQS